MRFRLLRAALVTGLVIVSADRARAAGARSVQCTSDPVADGAALVQAFHDTNIANGGSIVLAVGCVYQLAAPAPVEDLGFFFGPTGLPVVTSTIVVEGNGATIRRDPAAAAFRLITVAGPAGQIPGAAPVYPHAGALTLRNLTLAGGQARGGAGGASATDGGGGGAGLGGAILDQGTVTLEAVTITGCVAQGGAGGGAGLGGGGGGGLGGAGAGGGGGFAGDGAIAGGGAVTSASGATPGDWSTTPSPWGLGAPPNGRGGVDGADPDGGFGGGGASISGAAGGAGGTGGGGGACLVAAACTGGAGGFGGGGGGTPVAGARGGGSRFGGGNGAPDPTTAPGFGGGAAGTPAPATRRAYGGGGAGLGGAIFVHGGALVARNVTFFDNSARGGNGGGTATTGDGAVGGSGGAGHGAAIFVLDGMATIASATLSGNHARGGDGGAADVPGVGGAAAGALVAVHVDGEATTAGAPTMVTIDNTIITATDTAAAPADDCAVLGGATLVSGGTNLIRRAGTCVFAGAGDVTDLSPALAALADNGGPVATLAVTGDPGATTGACTALVDARGVPRVAPCAIGAFQPGGYPLIVITEGGGSVTSAPAGIDCGASCTATIDPRAVPVHYTFTATAGAGTRFAGWGGACGGSFPTCTVDLTGPATVRALFFTPAPDAGVGLGDAGLPPIGGGDTGCCDVRTPDSRSAGLLVIAVALGLRRRRRARSA
jgi:hypothetical protein